jgi:hypothetical protein
MMPDLTSSTLQPKEPAEEMPRKIISSTEIQRGSDLERLCTKEARDGHESGS